MLNYIWLGLMAGAILYGCWMGCLNPHGLKPEIIDNMVKGGFDAAKAAVIDIALPLSAIMMIWLGIMRLAEKSGVVAIIGRMLRPVLRRLFPDVPADHPAMGSMVMNIAANMLGLGNAATPLGLRAMGELQKLNRIPGVATNAMCTFLAINTSSVQLIPATAIGLLAINHGNNPTAIVGTALLASLCAQIAGLTSVKLLERLPIFRATAEPSAEPVEEQSTKEVPAQAESAGSTPLAYLTTCKILVVLALLLFFGAAFVSVAAFNYRQGTAHSASAAALAGVKSMSLLAIPFFLVFFPVYATLRGVKVYEEFVEGAKEGFAVAVRIMPYLVAIMVAMRLFREAGAVDWLVAHIRPALDLIGFPADLVPLAMMRPLSGSGSNALFADIILKFGPDHIYSYMAGTILGSTETTFYVLAVYFGSVGIRRTRHAVAAGLIADVVGVLASVKICQWMLG